MGYTMLNNAGSMGDYAEYSLEGGALRFIRELCEKLRFDESKAADISDLQMSDHDGKSIKAGQIPFNMEKDIDRLCMEKAVSRFLKSGRREDAFDVYFCYLEMFIGDYEKTRRMIELLSEFEANGSGLLMKHRDHYSHSVYVFCLGLAIFASNKIYRDTYKAYYAIKDDGEAACHYLKYWGLSSLFHDIGYPFELPFEQVCSYFEVNGDDRSSNPFLGYHNMDSFVQLSDPVKKEVSKFTDGIVYNTTNEVFAHVLAKKLGSVYDFTEEKMNETLRNKPEHPDKFNYYMDHAYFSATVLFKKLFEEMECELTQEHLDALTAILMHNSLYKFSIASYKGGKNKPFKAELHPLAYMLMLCDELQCWDRTAYGRNSKRELHPMDCAFDFSNNKVKAVYLYDEKEIGKINRFKGAYIEWLQKPEGKSPALKAYSGMYIKENGVSDFQKDIERIVDLSEISIQVETGLAACSRTDKRSYLSNSNFIHLYNFAVVLNGRWDTNEWKKAKESGNIDSFIENEALIEEFTDRFKNLSLEYKLSNINQAKAFAKYMDAIGCFYTDKPVDYEMVDYFSEDELSKIGVLEHRRWLQEHYDMGWEYGQPDKTERESLRQHMDMLPGFRGWQDVSLENAKKNYERLDQAEQDKDTEPMECMLTMLRMFDGLRIYRLN